MTSLDPILAVCGVDLRGMDQPAKGQAVDQPTLQVTEGEPIHFKMELVPQDQPTEASKAAERQARDQAV